MRILLLILLMPLGQVWGQTSYQYTFKVEDAEIHGVSKEIINEFRSFYNTFEDPRRFFPVYDNVQNLFTANSEIVITMEEMTSFLSGYGYTLLSYERKEGVKELSSNPEEE